MKFRIRSQFSIFFILVIVWVGAVSTNGDHHQLFRRGMIHIKLRAEVQLSPLLKSGNTLGLASLDRRFSQYDIRQVEKTFIHRPIPTGSNLPDLTRIYTIYFPEEKDVERMAREFALDPSVEYAEPVILDRVFAMPDDSLYSSQYFFELIRAEEAWNVHRGESGDSVIVIGIVDLGVDWHHPDLIDNLYRNLGEDADGDGRVLEYIDSVWVFDPGDINSIDDDGNGYADDFIGWNFCASHDWDALPSNDPDDPQGHGTHVAGVAAGVTDNGKGISSISWNVKFLPTAHAIYLTEYDDYFMLDAYQGMVYLAENGADIINCSYGSSSESQVAKEALDYAAGLGSMVVASAGNEGSSSPQFPAAFLKAISVGGTNRDNQRIYFSNYGITVDINAPGTNILSSIPDGLYRSLSGTSMASPIVAGLLGLMKSRHPDWENRRLLARLLATAINIDSLNINYADQLGYGLIDAFRAISDTEAVLPQEYLLVWGSEVNLHAPGTDSLVALERGQLASLDFTVTNYRYYGDNEPVIFNLSCDYPGVDIIDGVHSAVIPGSAETAVTDAFRIRIRDDSEMGYASFKISVETSARIVQGGEFQCELLVAPEGFLVWEPVEGVTDCSGSFIRDFLLDQNLPVLYINKFPVSLTGFQGVFLSWGNKWRLYPLLYGPVTGFTLESCSELLEDYLAGGGSLFMDGDAIISNLNEFGNLASLLGISDIEQSPLGFFPDTLIGGTGSVCDGMLFPAMTCFSSYRTDLYLPGTGGSAALRVNDTTVVAIQGEGVYGQKTFCYSPPLSALLDGSYPSSRRLLLANVLQFFGFSPSPFADFRMESVENSLSSEVQFHDLSWIGPDSAHCVWYWDFDNDGHVDSNQRHPRWSYRLEGVYDVGLKINTGRDSAEYTQGNALYRSAAGAALKFNDASKPLYIATDSKLDLSPNLTVEFWLKIDSSFLQNSNNTALFSKQGALNLYLTEKCGINVSLNFEGGHSALFVSEDNLLTLDHWHHAAIALDARDSLFYLYLDGSPVLAMKNENPDLGLNWLIEDSGVDMELGDQFPGTIDELRIWNYARNGEQIAASMFERLTGSESGLVGCWPMDEGCGQWITDIAGQGLWGVVNNPSWVAGVPLHTSGLGEVVETSDRASLQLSPAYPNPFNPHTMLEYRLPRAADTRIEVFNIMGQKVRELVNGRKMAGVHRVVWDGNDDAGASLASGVYLMRLRVGAEERIRKVMMMK